MNGEDFDPLVLHDAFVQTICDLKALNEVTQQKFDRLKASVAEEEQNFWKKVTELQEKNKVRVTDLSSTYYRNVTIRPINANLDYRG